jgi:phage-related protein
MQYPFLQKIRQILDQKQEKLVWLAAKIDKSERWFFNNQDINKVELGIVNRISEILDFNFGSDYNKWLIEHEQKPMAMLHEPDGSYDDKVNRVTITLKISAPDHIAEDNTSKLLTEIRKQGEKLGFKLE